MRLFIAIELSKPMRQAIAKVVVSVRPHFPGTDRKTRWTPSEQYHLTLKFIGECPEASLPGLEEAIKTAAGESTPFPLILSGLGSFRSGRDLSVLWLGIQEGRSAISALAESVERRCTEAGFAPERKPYHPHLTLARFHGTLSRIMLDKLPHPLRDNGLGPEPVANLSMIQSILSATGARYRTLLTVPFGIRPE